MKITLPIGELARCLELFAQDTLRDNEEVDVGKLGMRVSTPTGEAMVNFFIKKFKLPLLLLSFSNGYTLRCAKNHILRCNGKDIYAKDLCIGDELDHSTGVIRLTSVEAVPNDDCYDISIPSPHLYHDANGLIHHNTVMTAALSKSIEHLGRSLVIVPNKSLVVQTEADYINLGLDVGVYFGDRKDYGKTHTICTWQSLSKLCSAESEISINDYIQDVACVIVDECFAGDSKVLTPTGYVPIKEIKPGDTIINYSELTGVFKEDTVIKQHHNLTISASEKMYELEFDNGSIIRVTGNHKFLTNLGWCRADELTDNHEIINKT